MGTTIGVVRVYDFEENCITKMVNKKVSAGVLSISISTDNLWMVVGHLNGRVALWNIDFLVEPKLLKVVEFSKTPILSLDFVSDLNELVIVSD